MWYKGGLNFFLTLLVFKILLYDWNYSPSCNILCEISTTIKGWFIGGHFPNNKIECALPFWSDMLYAKNDWENLSTWVFLKEGNNAFYTATFLNSCFC